GAGGKEDLRAPRGLRPAGRQVGQCPGRPLDAEKGGHREPRLGDLRAELVRVMEKGGSEVVLAGRIPMLAVQEGALDDLAERGVSQESVKEPRQEGREA